MNAFVMGFPSGSVVKNPPALQEMWRCGFHPWNRKIPWRRKGQPTPVFLPGHSIRLQRDRHTHSQHASPRKIFKDSFLFLQLGKNQEQTFHLLIPNKALNVKRSLKKTADQMQ